MGNCTSLKNRKRNKSIIHSVLSNQALVDAINNTYFRVLDDILLEEDKQKKERQAYKDYAESTILVDKQVAEKIEKYIENKIQQDNSIPV